MRFVLTLLLGVLSGTAFSDVISIRADAWCPFNCEPKTERPGYFIEIARLAFARHGHTVEYRTLNWSRAISESRSGKFTAIAGAFKSDAPDFVYPDIELGLSRNCFYTTPKSKFSFTNLESLKGHKLGAIRGYSYGDLMDGYISKHEKNTKILELVAGEEPLRQNIKKLEKKRIDVFIDDFSVVSHFLSGTKTKIELKESGCLDPVETYIGFSPAHPKAKEFAALLAAGVRELRANGELAKVLKKYGLSDWKQ